MHEDHYKYSFIFANFFGLFLRCYPLSPPPLPPMLYYIASLRQEGGKQP